MESGSIAQSCAGDLGDEGLEMFDGFCLEMCKLAAGDWARVSSEGIMCREFWQRLRLRSSWRGASFRADSWRFHHVVAFVRSREILRDKPADTLQIYMCVAQRRLMGSAKKLRQETLKLGRGNDARAVAALRLLMCSGGNGQEYKINAKV